MPPDPQMRSRSTNRRGPKRRRSIALLTTLLASGAAVCTSKNECDQAADRIEAKFEECGTDIPSDSEACGGDCSAAQGQYASCVADCVDATPCSGLDGSDVDAAAAYLECLGACGSPTCGDPTGTTGSGGSSGGTDPVTSTTNVPTTTGVDTSTSTTSQVDSSGTSDATTTGSSSGSEESTGGEGAAVINDPDDGFGVLDITQVQYAEATDGRWYVYVQVDGTWPPQIGIYSYYLQIVLTDASGTIVDCITERHDGVPATYCGQGNVGDLEVIEGPTGVVMAFANISPPEQMSALLGHVATMGGMFDSDTAMGPFGTGVTDIPVP